MASKKNFKLTITLILAAIILILCGTLFYTLRTDRIHFWNDLRHISQDSYDSLCLSMHSSSGYTPENFMAYSALNTFVSSYEIQSMEELQRYLEKAFSSGNEVGNVFLLLDPEMIKRSCGDEDSDWDAALQSALFSFADSHPETCFKILLPYPSLSYWVQMEPAAMENVLSLYADFVEDTYEHANIFAFFMGFENWLLINPDNYVSDFDLNDVIAKKIYLLCFCDGVNQITPINGEILFDMLREQVAAERTSPAVYPDLSDYCLVFFGDSILAYGEGTVTTPGFITGLSHAVTYNYAVGGTPAGDFPNAFSHFLSEGCTQEGDGTYRFTPSDQDISDKKLCFLLLYGANDYFSGNAVDNPEDPFDASTYAGVLRSSLKQYMPLFPDAQFIIITPGYTNYYSNGMDRMSDVGGVLTEYVDAAVSVAEEFDIPHIDNYYGFGIDDSNILDYSADGCHPNEDGRVLMAKHIMDFIENL